MVFVLIFLALFFPLFTGAKENTVPAVVINEIAWMGIVVEGVDARQEWRYEWLELHNRTTERSIVLNAWKVELYRPSSAKATEGKREELYFAIPLSGTIAAQGYFLIGASDKIPGVDVNYANLGGKFLNTGMKVVLKDSNNSVVHEVDAREGWPAGDNETKRTMERITCLQGSNPCKQWQTSEKPGGTPGQGNSEGFEEPKTSENPGDSSYFPRIGATKKAPAGPFQSFDVFSGTTLLAALLAAGSCVGILGLRRFLARPEPSRRARQSPHHFPNNAGQS